MAAKAGYLGVIKMDDTSGVLQTFTGYVKSADVSYDQDLLDVSVMGTKGKKKVAGQDDASATIEGPWEAQIDSWVGDPSTWATQRSFEAHPEGTGTGTRKHTFEAFIKSFSVKPDVGDALRYSIGIEKTGNATWGTNP